jgi:hypothetical protein
LFVVYDALPLKIIASVPSTRMIKAMANRIANIAAKEAAAPAATGENAAQAPQQHPAQHLSVCKNKRLNCPHKPSKGAFTAVFC